MHFVILVEEPSAEAALLIIVPRIISSNTFEIIRHIGKSDLLRKLPSRLRGYKSWLPADRRIVVVVDADNQDCRLLKRELDAHAIAAGLRIRSTAETSTEIQVINRIAIEELEAWFFGDVQAMRAAYPRIPSTLDQKREYRDPDGIKGGTWEALERVLQAAGYQRSGLRKIETARTIAKHMDPRRNRSRSFQAFYRALAGDVDERP
jgi:hypothetical protein